MPLRPGANSLLHSIEAYLSAVSEPLKRVLVDTNIVMDILLNREPHIAASSAVWAAIETGSVEGLPAAHAVTAIHYLIRIEQGVAKARRTVRAMLRVFGVSSGGCIRSPGRPGLTWAGPDFEGSGTAAAAKLAGCDLIVTRDPHDFRGSPVRALMPAVAAPILAG